MAALRPLLVLLAAALFGCGAAESDLPTLTLATQPLRIVVLAQGELAAAKATPINVPAVVQNSQVIRWLLAENSPVKAGEVVARFDGGDAILARDKSRLEIERVALQQAGKEIELNGELGGIADGLRENDLELGLTERYANAAPGILSRHEIIDALLDRDFLDAQGEFQLWRRGRHGTRLQAETSLLGSQRERHQTVVQQNEAILTQLELRAPHDGVMVYQRNWWGEKPGVGQTVWPGMKLGELPDARSMEARLYALESEAVGLAVGQRVEVRIDAQPDLIMRGKVKQVDALAKARERDNPVRYFQFVVELPDANVSSLRGGSQVHAEVFVAEREQALALPNQALFRDQEQSWVYVQRGDDFVRRAVTTGVRSATRSEVLDGLRPGDVVALAEPKAESGK